MINEQLTPSERRVLHLMQDGKYHSTRDIIINAQVTDGNRAILRLRDRGYQFTTDWRKFGGSSFKVWRLKVN